MNAILDLLVRHGIAILLAMEFIEQVGIPLPAAPWLLAAGTLIGAGKMNGWMALSAATLGSLLGDLIWFYLGRYYGSRVLGLLCRISLEPDSCARRTQNLFTRYGMPGLVFAKFVPGLGTLAPPLAGNSGVTTARFLVFDGLSSLLHGGGFILAGVLFSHQLAEILNALAGLGRGAFAVLAGLATLYIAYKYFQRHRLLKELRMARITVDELYQMQEAGEHPLILDLRQPVELQLNASVIREALRMTPDEVEHRHQEIPRDRDIVLYCSCPNEVTSARVALQLRRQGILRVRPLLGGIEAWRKRNYPMKLSATAPATAELFSGNTDERPKNHGPGKRQS
jgi:membrane protein DedA with SNARE-associated domain/rhodanese-related sulfurtransferase